MRLALATDAAGAIPWTIGTRSGCLWTTDHGRKFFGLLSGPDSTFYTFLAVIHPGDRELVRHVAEATVEYHKYQMMEDLGVKTVTDLVRSVVKHGIFTS